MVMIYDVKVHKKVEYRFKNEVPKSTLPKQRKSDF